jgi:hypothetical protein
MTTNNNTEAMAAAARAKARAEANQRVQEMGATLTKMHTVLKQMRAKAPATAAKDSTARANIEMWSLLLDTLDKQYDQLVAATKAREDLEMRRQSLYKQADEKATAAALAAKAQQVRAAEQAKNAATGAQGPTPEASQAATAPAAAQTPAPVAAPSAPSSPN